MTEELAAAAFELWQARYHADPAEFMTHDETDGLEPPTYGELAARYFLKLLTELEG